MRPAGFSCRRTRPVCTGRTCWLPRSPRSRRLHGLPCLRVPPLPMVTQAAPSAQAECLHRPEVRARPGPLRAPHSQSFRPKSALNAVGCLSVRRLLPPPRTSPPDFRRCLSPCRAPTAQNRGARLHAFSRAKLPQAPQQGRRHGKQTERRDLPRAGFPLPGAFFPMQTQKPGNAPSPARPSPPHERRRAADDSVALLRRAAVFSRLRRSYCFGR